MFWDGFRSSLVSISKQTIALEGVNHILVMVALDARQQHVTHGRATLERGSLVTLQLQLLTMFRIPLLPLLVFLPDILPESYFLFPRHCRYRYGAYLTTPRFDSVRMRGEW